MTQPTRLRDDFFAGLPRYEFLDTLGHGGMAVVFKARDRELDEVIAIKVLLVGYEHSEEELLLRLKQEISLNRKIKHPNVARMYDFGLSGSFRYLTMEFIEGLDLGRILEDVGRLKESRLVPILRQIALGADAAHRLGIVHRDLKPQNIILSPEGAAVLLDFGLARSQRRSSITQQGIIVGTPHYMAPEQATGEEPDARSDIFSLGVVAFHALTGDVPFDGPSPIATVMSIVNDPLPVRALDRPDVSPELAAIVVKCLRKRREERFQTAEALATELALLPQGRSGTDSGTANPTSRPTGDRTRALKWSEAVKGRLTPFTPAAPAVAGPAAARPVVLLADDDESVRAPLTAALERNGLDVRPVTNGREVLERAFAAPFDLLLMDVVMPELDGFDATRILRSHRELASLPIVLVSGEVGRNHMAFALQAGATDLLLKPFRMDQLLERVWSILERRGFTRPRPPFEEEATAVADGYRVLLVDDESRILEAMKSFFSMRGFSVDASRELEEAQALMDHFHYDVVITDLRLTGTHGDEGLEVITHARERCPEAKIILLTGYSTPEMEAEARRRGADVFLQKPRPLQELARIASDLLEGVRA